MLIKFLCSAGFTEIIQILCKGLLTESLPESVRLYLATGAIKPLWKNKEKTDIRPVTVPSLISRVLSKCINSLTGKVTGATLAPLQIGVNGSTAMEHMNVLLRGMLSKDPDLVLVSFDVSNAFGATQHSKILQEVLRFGDPLITQYFLATYRRPSRAMFVAEDGSVKYITNRMGVQQGDSMSGLFFSLALQPALVELEKRGLRLVIAYYDDVYCLCTREQARGLVSGDFQRILDDTRVGLRVNSAKTLVYSPGADLGEGWGCKLQHTGCTVLGVPLGKPEFIRSHLESCVASLKTICLSFPALSVQSAYLLLRFCGVQRLNHLWRTTPSSIAIHFSKEISTIIWTTTRSILRLPQDDNAIASTFDFARARNSLKLPISMGGAGLTDPYDTVTGAFLAGLKDGLRSIQPNHPQVFDWWMERFASDIPQDAPMDLEALLRSVTASFKRCASAFAALDQDETPAAAPPRTITELLDAVGPTQYKITEVMMRLERQKLFSSLPASHRATFLSRSSPHGLDFLLAHPSSTSFRLSDEDMSFGLRAVAFLPPTNEDYTAISAALLTETEREGLHENYDFARALFRKYAHGWVRHFGITHVFGECAKHVGFLVGYEPRIEGIGSRGCGDIRIFHYTPEGQDYIIDASVAVADGKAYVQRAANTAGVAARLRVDSKDNKYEPTVRALGKIFKAYIVEDAGYIEQNVHSFFHTCALRACDYPDAVPEFTTWAVRSFDDYWYQRLSCKLVSGNAIMFRTARAKCLERSRGLAGRAFRSGSGGM